LKSNVNQISIDRIDTLLFSIEHSFRSRKISYWYSLKQQKEGRGNPWI